MAIVGLGGEKLWLCPSLNDSPYDISGNGNNGTYNGGMGTVADVSKGGKRAYSFDGIDDRIALSSSAVNPLFCGTNSVALWMRIEGNTFVADGNTTLVGHDSTATTWYNFTYINNGGLRSFADNGAANGIADATSAQAGGTFEDDVWRHVVCIRDYANQQVRFYVDGTEVASVSSTVTAPSSISDNPFVGYSSLYGYASGYNGGVYIRYDDIRIFDRVLTTAEIKHLAKARGITGTPLKKGLGDEKLWLCPSIDDSAEDLSGNGNNGTYNGGMGTVADTSNGGSRAYSFDNVDDYISISSFLNLEAPLTVTGWIKKTSGGSGSAQVLFDTGTGSGNSGISVSLDSSFNNVLHFTFGGVAGYNLNLNYYTISGNQYGVWQPFAVTVDSNNGTATGYLGNQSNSVSIGSKSSTVTTQAAIGADTSGNVFAWGYIDDIRVFERVLSTSEITHLASARGVAGSPYGFKGLGDEKLWLCPTLDDSAEDISGNRHHGVYQGNATTVTDTSNGGSKAYSFATGGDCIVHDQFGGPLSESQTVSWWSKHNGTSRVHQISCTVHEPDGYVGGSNNRWLYEVFNNTTERFWPSSSSNHNVTRSTANTWRHNCWIRDNGSGDSLFYVDGVLDTTVTPPSIYDADTNISNFLIGLAGGNPTVDLYIDDVRTFGRPLTQEEITHLAKSRGVLGSPYNLNGIVHLLSSFIHPFT